MVGREHHADRRHHDLERRVVERERLGVGLDPVQIHAGRVGAAPTGLEQIRYEVAGDDVGAALGSGDRRVAGAGGDVEDARAGGDLSRVDEFGAEREQEGLDHRGIVAGRPHGAVLRLEGIQGEGCGGEDMAAMVAATGPYPQR